MIKRRARFSDVQLVQAWTSPHMETRYHFCVGLPGCDRFSSASVFLCLSPKVDASPNRLDMVLTISAPSLPTAECATEDTTSDTAGTPEQYDDMYLSQTEVAYDVSLFTIPVGHGHRRVDHRLGPSLVEGNSTLITVVFTCRHGSRDRCIV